MRASATELRALLERVEAASGPDRELWLSVIAATVAPAGSRVVISRFNLQPYIEEPRAYGKEPFAAWEWRDVPSELRADRAEHSIDASLALVELALPGWCWRVGTCHVSDDAWLCPDWNDPEHGQRLRDEFGGPVHGTIWDHGVDIDRRPPGNPTLAVLEALLTALLEIEERAALPDHHQEPRADAAREG